MGQGIRHIHWRGSQVISDAGTYILWSILFNYASGLSSIQAGRTYCLSNWRSADDRLLLILRSSSNLLLTL